MVTTLGYALLGLLARGSHSGYDLARAMQKPIGFYWHARHSQIYPELARLEAHGLATFEVVVQHDVPSKKVYTITEAGRTALRDWVITAPNVPAVRDELVLRAFSLWVADPHAAQVVFRTHEQQHREQLRHYELFVQELHDAYGAMLTDPRSQGFGEYATLQAGIAYEQMYIAWCEWVQQQLAQRTDADAG
jgi:DNA-binding PadR family transcriptional regulator